MTKDELIKLATDQLSSPNLAGFILYIFNTDGVIQETLSATSAQKLAAEKRLSVVNDEEMTKSFSKKKELN